MKIRIQTRNTRSKIWDAPQSLREALMTQLAFTDEAGLSISLFDGSEDCFPTGLLSMVLDILRERKIECEYEDLREIPESTPLDVTLPSLRQEYQVPDFNKMFDSVRGIVKWPTGAGKTLLAMHYIAQTGIFPVLFLVDRLSLLEQTIGVFQEAFGESNVGRINETTAEIKPITIGMVQTIYSGLKKRSTTIEGFIKSVRSIIVDEAHHCPANSTFVILREATKAYRRFGLSATPYRSDGLDIMIDAALGQRIVDRSASELYELGYLVRADIRFREVPQIKWQPGYENWHTIYRDGITNNGKRNDLIVSDALDLYDDDRRTVIFVNQIAHGKKLVSLLRERLPSDEISFVDGELPPGLRKIIFDKVMSKEIRIMVATSLADEGLDIPLIDAAIMADGGKSPVEKIQQIGRTLRGGTRSPWPDKRDSVIRDYLDRAPILGKHADDRMAVYMNTERLWCVSVEKGTVRTQIPSGSRGFEEW